jgi:hypothetical integral membrane protein (TIGR02206 family)
MSFWYDLDSQFRQTPYDLSHIIYILFVVMMVGLFIWKLDYIKDNSERFRKIFIGVIIFQMILYYSWSGIELGFALADGLPIHLCRMSTILGLIFLWSKNTKIMHVLFYTSLYALIAILYPVDVHPIYTHIIGYSFQISHLMIILTWLFGVYVYGYRPSYKIMHYTFVGFVGALLVVWRFNYWIGDGSYLYLRSDVNRPFFKEWPDILWIGAILALSYLIMLFVTYLFNRKKAV